MREYRERGVVLHGLTSFIGLEHEIMRIDVLAVPVRSGDRLLLCTDGVHHQLDDDQIRQAHGVADVPAGRRPAGRAGRSVGGRDNATALVLQLGAERPDGTP